MGLLYRLHWSNFAAFTSVVELPRSSRLRFFKTHHFALQAATLEVLWLCCWYPQRTEICKSAAEIVVPIMSFLSGAAYSVEKAMRRESVLRAGMRHPPTCECAIRWRTSSWTRHWTLHNTLCWFVGKDCNLGCQYALTKLGSLPVFDIKMKKKRIFMKKSNISFPGKALSSYCKASCLTRLSDVAIKESYEV